MTVPGFADSTNVQVAIEEKKKLLAEKEAALRRTLGRSKDTTLDPLDDSSLPRQTKAIQTAFAGLSGTHASIYPTPVP